jgi:DNA-binding CsgD family transcriptional regulator
VSAEHLDTARRLDEATGGTEYGPALLAAVAKRAVWAGDLQAARDAVDAGLEMGADDAVPDPGLAWLAALGLRAEADAAAVARARHDEAALSLSIDRARRIAGRLPPPERIPGAAWEGRGLAILSLCGAELARLDGPDGADPAAWEDAAETWEAVERPFTAAYCRARQGEALLASRGSRDDARAAFATARSTAARLGAAPLLGEIDLLARQARLDLARPATPTGEAPSAATPAASEADALGLTPRELEVLRLVAGGWSNQQIADALFITRKTASVHVSNILGKLGVSGRTEAAAIAHRMGLGRDAPPPPDSDAVR